MKLLLCLCLIFCIKTVFSDVICYVCETTNYSNNPELNKCIEHNRYNLIMCCSTYQFNCGRFISQSPAIPNHLFSQHYPFIVNDFQKMSPVNPLDVLQPHAFPVPRQPNYGNVGRSYSTHRFEPRPYEQPSYGNRNLPSNGFNFHQNNPQPYYPTRPNFPRQDTERFYPRPPVPFQPNPNFPRQDTGSFYSRPPVPFQPNPNFPQGPTQFYDNNNNNDDSNYGGHSKKEHHTHTYEVINGIPYVKNYSYVQNDTDIGSESYSHTKKHNFESVNGVPKIDKTTVNVKKEGSPDGDDVDAVEESRAEFIPASENYQPQNDPSSSLVRRARSPQSNKIY